MVKYEETMLKLWCQFQVHSLGMVRIGRNEQGHSRKGNQMVTTQARHIVARGNIQFALGSTNYYQTHAHDTCQFRLGITGSQLDRQ